MVAGFTSPHALKESKEKMVKEKRKWNVLYREPYLPPVAPTFKYTIITPQCKESPQDNTVDKPQKLKPTKTEEENFNSKTVILASQGCKLINVEIEN